MSHLYPFPLQNFEAYCNSLDRVGIDPGYVMYTNHHASNGKPAARLVSSEQLPTAKAYIANQTDEHFKSLVELGAMFDTEWDRKTEHWEIIAYKGWEVLHTAFNHLHVKSGQTLMELTGVSNLDFTEAP